MLKYIFFILFTFLLIPWGSAQSQNIEVVASMGADITVGQYHISSTVGEASIQSLRKSNYVLTQGFQQPDISISTLVKELKNPAKVHLYPNPAQIDLYVESDSELIRYLDVYDALGKFLFRQKIHSSIARLHVQPLQEGQYYMKISGYNVKRHPQWVSFIVLR